MLQVNLTDLCMRTWIAPSSQSNEIFRNEIRDLISLIYFYVNASTERLRFEGLTGETSVDTLQLHYPQHSHIKYIYMGNL